MGVNKYSLIIVFVVLQVQIVKHQVHNEINGLLLSSLFTVCIASNRMLHAPFSWHLYGIESWGGRCGARDAGEGTCFMAASMGTLV